MVASATGGLPVDDGAVAAPFCGGNMKREPRHTAVDGARAPSTLRIAETSASGLSSWQPTLARQRAKQLAVGHDPPAALNQRRKHVKGAGTESGQAAVHDQPSFAQMNLDLVDGPAIRYGAPCPDVQSGSERIVCPRNDAGEPRPERLRTFRPHFRPLKDLGLPTGGHFVIGSNPVPMTGNYSPVGKPRPLLENCND